MVKETVLDFCQSFSNLASHWVEDVELESVIGVWVPVFALKPLDVQLVV